MRKETCPSEQVSFFAAVYLLYCLTKRQDL